MAESGGATPVLTEEYLNEYSGDILIAASITFAVLTTIVLILRFYAKRFTRAQAFGLDDLFLTAAYVVNLGMCAIGITMVKLGGVGQHVEAVEERNPAALVNWAKAILAFEIVYFTSVALPKMAIVFLYLRVFNWQGNMRRAAYLLLAALAATGFSLVMTACFQCRPLAFWWDRTIPGGTCIDVQAFFHIQAIPGIVLDIFIMALPTKTIWNLKLPLHKRIALLMIFLLASFGIVASIIRAVAFFGTAAFADRTWASVELVGWSIVETGTYILTVCMPSLKPLISHYTPQAVKDFVRKGVSAASHGLSSSSRDKKTGNKSNIDSMELEMRSKGHDVEVATAKPRVSHSTHESSGTTRSNGSQRSRSSSQRSQSSHRSREHYSPTNKATVEVLNTPDLIGNGSWYRMHEEAGRRNEGIHVTTEVTLESHPGVKGRSFV